MTTSDTPAAEKGLGNIYIFASSNLCKEYLDVATMKIPLLLQIKNWIFRYVDAFLYHHLQEL